MRRASTILVALLLAGGACDITTDPAHPLVTYGIAVHPCVVSDCSVPDDTIAITSADRGDTVWVFSGVEGGNPLVGDSALVTVRADCAENLALLNDAATTVRAIPSPVTCPDSVLTIYVHRPPATVEYRYFQWIVDSATPPGSYRLEGRMLVQPNLRPAIIFAVQ